MANNENLKFLRDAWNSMSTDQKTIVGVLAAMDTVGKAVALRDLARAEDSKLRGPKWLWTPIIGVVNTFGWVSYFLIGKKR
ncbi:MULTISPECIES: PLDc N-terminal domain-containing protein [Corynebacterium]|uniref:PLDc N-terminal domain-containing protein n=1 Tax=Corynebacterium lipophilum TaxID=2804918 RepID=A0AAW5HQV7_9CORY|nr:MULTISPECIES: PLDc N-terminal domain-containing protein [Corynebacterium]MCO6393685.1 PLDc N-terminal domain-containing protein [Corynebacterium lipophilum]MCZ2117096.1 PLDc N-terminal domain-containing protein [Corynebacterium lipophilum]OFT31460.1 hypothetical protein HMPREF3170_00745 [Corynebacterium sp. HMSC08D02]OIR45201.1 hypothetical protein BJP06_01825 [Corynebacterium sp. NML120713]UUA86338.1 PLDc N-terminal domain-containing protein [Corynebacterium pseudogenitalium]